MNHVAEAVLAEQTERSKSLRELREIADIMEEQVYKPSRANGTRWVQHKSTAASTLLKCYKIIIAHLEAQESGSSSLDSREWQRIKGYLRELKSCKLVLYLHFLQEILDPLSRVMSSSPEGQHRSTCYVNATPFLPVNCGNTEADFNQY